MKEIVRYGLILALICTIASGLLAGVNYLTKARIIAEAKQEEEASLKEVVPGGQHFELVKSGEEVIYYKVHNKEGKLMGFAFKVQAKGYSSLIETMVGMTQGGTITAIKILSQNETPGLGNRIAEPSFTSRFTNRNVQGLSEVQAISGATISSRAVIDSVKKRAAEIQQFLRNEK